MTGHFPADAAVRYFL